LLAAVLPIPRDLGDFLVAQLLEVPQNQDFAVEGIHGIEGLLEPDLHLGPDGGTAGRRQPVQQLLGQALGRRRASCSLKLVDVGNPILV
jgi:hypothetical protein